MRSLPAKEDLVRLVHDRCADGPPLERLRAAAEVAEDLGRRGDELLGHFVDAARDAGCSWADIGRQFGVSRQAAQQRFVEHRRGLALPLPRRFVGPARRVAALAEEEARRLGHGHIGTEHLLLGILLEGEGLAARALEALGVSLEAARRRVLEAVGTGDEPRPGRLPFTPRAKRVLELALREAAVLGHDYIGTEHILLAVAREREGVTAKVVEELGAGPARVRGQLAGLLPPPRRGRARPRRTRRRGGAPT